MRNLTDRLIVTMCICSIEYMLSSHVNHKTTSNTSQENNVFSSEATLQLVAKLTYNENCPSVC